MRRVSLVLAAALAAAGLAPLAAAAADDTTTRSYVGGPGDLVVVCREGSRPDVGGACFTEVPSVDAATIAIDDEVTDPTAGSYLWVLEGGQRTAVPFCGSTTIDVPRAAVELDVLVSEAFGPATCPAAGAGTAGHVTVTWGPAS